MGRSNSSSLGLLSGSIFCATLLANLRFFAKQILVSRIFPFTASSDSTKDSQRDANLVLSEEPQVAEQLDHGVQSVRTIGWGQKTGLSLFPAQKPVSDWSKAFPEPELTGRSSASSSPPSLSSVAAWFRSSWQVNPPFRPDLHRRLRLR